MLTTYIIIGLIIYFLVGAVTSGLLLRWNITDEEGAAYTIIIWPMLWLAIPTNYAWIGLKWLWKNTIVRLRNKIAGRK